jgi:putative phosphoesterase
MSQHAQGGAARAFVGLISDTHGLVRPEALTSLDGAAHIIHAGDIGGEPVLAALRRIAPVSAVRGNNDTGAWAHALPETLRLQLGRHAIYVLHDLRKLTLDPAAEGISVVIAGHSHKPVVFERDNVLYVNPGSAGPRRFRLPISVAKLHLGDTPSAELTLIEP